MLKNYHTKYTRRRVNLCISPCLKGNCYNTNDTSWSISSIFIQLNNVLIDVVNASLLLIHKVNEIRDRTTVLFVIYQSVIYFNLNNWFMFWKFLKCILNVRVQNVEQMINNIKCLNKMWLERDFHDQEKKISMTKNQMKKIG